MKNSIYSFDQQPKYLFHTMWKKHKQTDLCNFVAETGECLYFYIKAYLNDECVNQNYND